MSYANFPPSPYPSFPPPNGQQYTQYTYPAPAYPPILQTPRPKSSPDPAEPLEPSVSGPIASQAIQKLVSGQLHHAGFDGAEPLALQRLENEVIAFVEELYSRAHEYANLANRSRPVVTDLMLAKDERDLDTTELYHLARKSKKRKRDHGALILAPPPPRTPSPELLPSEDEGVMPPIPATLRMLECPLPKLPPKHTYLKTPPSPPKKAAPSSLQKKLKTAGLVQDSLKNLLLATEDTTGQEDGEVLGHIVNWEAHVYPRKRWRIGS